MYNNLMIFKQMNFNLKKKIIVLYFTYRTMSTFSEYVPYFGTCVNYLRRISLSMLCLFGIKILFRVI